MKTSTFISIVLATTMGFSGLAMANCADDAVDTCNAKHPNPNKSDHAYELYELCLKAQLSQKCPASVGSFDIDSPATNKKLVLPATSKRTSKRASKSLPVKPSATSRNRRQ